MHVSAAKTSINRAGSTRTKLQQQNQSHQLLQRLTQRLKIAHWHDWYHVTHAQVLNNGGRSLLQRYNNSLSQMLMSMHTEHPWQPWRFHQVPKGFLDSKDNQTAVLSWLAQQLGIRKYEDWYHVTTQQLLTLPAASSLLAKYKNSLSRMLQQLHPQYPWLPWRFTQVPQGHWDSFCNQRQAADRIARNLSVRNWVDWYHVTQEQVVQSEGGSLLSLHSNSVCRMLQALYPEYCWLSWMFVQCPKGFWDSLQNQRVALEWLSKQLGVSHWEGWYDVTKEQIIRHGCAGLLLVHGNSPSTMVQSLVPEYQWISWKFHTIPKGFWQERSNIQSYFVWLMQQHQIPHPSALASKPLHFYQANYGGMIAANKSHLKKALALAFPDVEWNFRGISLQRLVQERSELLMTPGTSTGLLLHSQSSNPTSYSSSSC